MNPIETGIEIPPKNKDKSKYGFYDFKEVGQSRFYPITEEGSINRLQQRACAAAKQFGRVHGFNFVTRKTTEDGVEGVRIWRTK